jgi:hypothetical protein
MEGITIASETLPGAGNAFYSFGFTAKEQSLIRSLEIITRYCEKFQLKVKALDVSINSEKNLFTVACSLSQSTGFYNAPEELGGKMKKIPEAFGYKEAPSARPIVVEKKEPELRHVGSIKDGKGQILFYRNSSDGKMHTRKQ